MDRNSGTVTAFHTANGAQQNVPPHHNQPIKGTGKNCDRDIGEGVRADLAVNETIARTGSSGLITGNNAESILGSANLFSTCDQAFWIFDTGNARQMNKIDIDAT